MSFEFSSGGQGLHSMRNFNLQDLNKTSICQSSDPAEGSECWLATCYICFMYNDKHCSVLWNIEKEALTLTWVQYVRSFPHNSLENSSISDPIAHKTLCFMLQITFNYFVSSILQEKLFTTADTTFKSSLIPLTQIL